MSTPIKILIVDDNAEMRQEIRASIPAAGYECIEATDGDEVLPSYTSFKPSVVIMDVRMKRLDGITATKNLLRTYPDANVVVLTQYMEPVYREAALDAGAKAYLSKDDIGSLTSLITTMTHNGSGDAR